jgi:hypothetical protein
LCFRWDGKGVAQEGFDYFWCDDRLYHLGHEHVVILVVVPLLGSLNGLVVVTGHAREVLTGQDGFRVLHLVVHTYIATYMITAAQYIILYYNYYTANKTLNAHTY